MKRLIIIFACFVLISSVFAYPVSAQADVSDIHTWINLDGGEERAEDVQDWLESDEADEYSELKEEAQEWLDELEQESEEIEDLGGASERISDDVTVTGYEFDYQNETVTFALQVESTTTISFQDVGATSTGGAFEYRTERLSAGQHSYTIDSEVYRAEYQQLQRLAIVDGSNQQGNSISHVHTEVLFEDAEVWMIPFSILVGAFTLIGLSIIYVKNKKDEGKGDMIPLK